MFTYGQIVRYHGIRCVWCGICKGKNCRYANLHLARNGANGFNVPEDKWDEIVAE